MPPTYQVMVFHMSIWMYYAKAQNSTIETIYSTVLSPHKSLGPGGCFLVYNSLSLPTPRPSLTEAKRAYVIPDVGLSHVVWPMGRHRNDWSRGLTCACLLVFLLLPWEEYPPGRYPSRVKGTEDTHGRPGPNWQLGATHVWLCPAKVSQAQTSGRE